MRRTAIMIATIGCLMACGERVAEPDPSGPVVSTVVIASPSGSIFRNDTLRLTASVRDQNGAELSGKTVAWSSSNSLVASVDTSGRVIGLTAGQVAVTAAAEGKSGAVQTWTLEGPSVLLLARNGWRNTSLRPGDPVRVLIGRDKAGKPAGTFVRVTLADGKVLETGRVK